jgi:Galactose oxidase, central domain
MKTGYLSRVLILVSMMAAPAAMGQTWVMMQPRGTPPPGRFNNTAVYDPASGRLIVFGGFKESVCCSTANDVWILTNASGHGGPRDWINLLPNGSPGAPPPLAAASAVFDARTNRMIVFGGQNANLGTSSGEVWVLNNANGSGGLPSWSKISFAPGPSPSPRQNHQAVYDPYSNRMIVVGGFDYNGSNLVLLNDVWALTNANGTGPNPPQWTQLAPQGDAPSPRHAFAAAYDQKNNRLSIFGGCVDAVFQCDNFLASSDLWVLSNANGTGLTAPSWQVFHFQLSPPARAQYAVGGYDPRTNRLYVMGGRIGSLGPFGLFSNFTWVLSHANGLGGMPDWRMLTPGKSPAPRGQSVPPNLFDPATGRLIVFGGPGLNDTWTLSTLGHGLFEPE